MKVAKMARRISYLSWALGLCSTVEVRCLGLLPAGMPGVMKACSSRALLPGVPIVLDN